MENKEFNKFEKARIKRTAQNVDQYVSKKNRLAAEIAEKQAEIEELQKMIDMSDAPIKFMTGGFGVEDLVKKVITPTDKLDKKGNIIKQTTFEFIYPDTIIPLVITVSDLEESFGSDYDVDTVQLEVEHSEEVED